MKVLVDGAQGYIGSVLGPYLAARSHEVRGVDSGFYASPQLYSAPESPLAFKDIRELVEQDLSGFDAVVHLAALSNDPMGQLMPQLTWDINFGGTLRMAMAARAAGVKRFVNFSSCSVYGANSSGARTESCPTEPLTEYSRSKLLAEAALDELASDSFTVVSMRNATVFGPSPRMRFDLVLNNLAVQAWTKNEIRLVSDGTPWRPVIHVGDLARATAMLIEAPSELVNRQLFNVGDDRLNHQVHEIADAVSRAFSNCPLRVSTSSGPDARSYKVSFAKIRERLGFACEYDIAFGAEELRQLFESVHLSEEMFELLPFDRLKWLKQLIHSRKLGETLLWLAASNDDNENAALAVGA